MNKSDKMPASTESKDLGMKQEHDIIVDLDTQGGRKQKDLIPEFKANHMYIVFFVLTMGVNGICVAWTTGGNN